MPPIELKHEEWQAIRNHYGEQMKRWATSGDFEAVERMVKRCKEIQASMTISPHCDY